MLFVVVGFTSRDAHKCSQLMDVSEMPNYCTIILTLTESSDETKEAQNYCFNMVLRENNLYWRY